MYRKKILSLLIGFFMFVVNAYSQTTYDFSTDATLSYGTAGSGIWYTQANITIGGVAYILTSGGNGSFSNSASGGSSNSKCLRKDGSGGDSFTLARVDGQPFQFYGIWVSHQSMNSYSSFYTLPPWYTLSTSGTDTFSYQDMTAMTAGTAWNNYTSSSIAISSGSGGKNVTSVQISFQAILYYSIDNIVVGPAVSSCTNPVVTGNPSNRSICVNGNTTFTASATGATAYQWQVNTGSGFTDITNGGVYSNATTSTLTITGATAGMNGYQYRCVAKDGTCTTNSSSGTLNVSNITSSTAKNDVLCFGSATGSAAVSPSGGIGSYTYSWAPSGGTASIATGLAAGTYTVTITDGIGCQITKTITINQPPAALSAASGGGKTDVSCNGGSNGTATVVPTGGTPGYTYSWSPSGGTAAIATGLAAGTYTCTITDANNCQTTRSFTINQPATALNASIGNKTDVSCNGGSNGSATVAPTGGTPSYTYSWAPSGGTAATATGLSAGTYTVTVTDANGCTATKSFTITQPTALNVTAGSKTDVSCNGGSNGSATVSPTGGTPSYTYSWAPSGGTAATATGLSAGTYTVTVTDANGCTATKTFTITQPTALNVTTGSKTDVSCNGGANGTATVIPTGGTPTYTYSWAPSGGTAATATGLSAGNYTVTVTDANGCIATKLFTITQPTILNATVGSKTDVSCNGGSNGTATVAPTGGTPAYTYSWAPSGGTAATATGLSAGNYTVTVTDANGCIATKLFTITQPTAISFTTTSLPGYDYNTSYSQNVVATGGTGSITYAVTSGSLPAGFTLSPAGVISGTSTQVADSNFTVTATDANSCTATYNFILKLNQIPITVTADASQTKVYGSSNPVLTYTVTPALLSGDSFTGSLSRAAGENVGSYVINQGTLSAGNKYLITYVSKNFAITAKPITVTANVSQTKVYGTTDPTFTYSVSPSLVSGDSFTGSLTRAAGENIGTYAINQGSLSAGSNYTISYVSKDFAITAKPITVTANVSQTKVYGTANPVYTYTVSPSLISGDAFTGLLSRVAGENVGTYAIQQGSLSAGSNYTISYVSKDFTITAKPITVTANVSQTKVYGTANPVYTYTVSPSLISGDSFTGALSRVTGENVGTYAIQQGSLSAGSNYAISYVSKDFAITAKPITVTVNASQTKVYGTSDPVFTYTVSPSLITGDSFTGALSRATGEDVGIYAITQGSLTAGTNYLISYVGANFSITKANQTISWNQILELGCDSGSSKNLTATASSGLPVSYVSSNANIATISNGVLAVHDYGFTTLTASQAGNNNYFPATVVVLTVTNSQPNLIRKQFEDIIFFDNSSKQFVSYTWYKDGVLVSGQTSQFYKENGALNGIYYAKATRLDGMVVTSCPLILSPTIEDEYIKIAPNPVKSNASYELLTNVSSSKLQNAHVEVYSVGGMLMQNVVTSQNTVKLTAPVVEGLYIVKMTLSNGKIFTKNLLVKN